MSETPEDQGPRLAPGEKLWPETVIIDGAHVSTDGLAGALDSLASWVHATTEAKGFYNPECEVTHEKLLLMIHEEASEVTRALREDNPPSTKIPGFSQVEEELADIVMRVLSFGEHYGYNVSGAAIAKALYNGDRPYMHGGKKY